MRRGNLVQVIVRLVPGTDLFDYPSTDRPNLRTSGWGRTTPDRCSAADGLQSGDKETVVGDSIEKPLRLTAITHWRAVPDNLLSLPHPALTGHNQPVNVAVTVLSTLCD